MLNYQLLSISNNNGFPVKSSEELKENILASAGITEQLMKLRHLQVFRSSIEKEEELIKSQIKDYMAEHEILTDFEGLPLVSFKTHTKTALDTAKFKASHPDLFKMYCKESSVRQFRIF